MTVATNLSPRPAAPGTPAPRRRAVLTIVPVREAAASRAPFVAAVVSLLVAGLIGLLVLNTVLGKDSFHLHELRQEARTLTDTEQALIREVEALRAPSTLAEKALEMGMVQAGPPAFLRLSDGAVLGHGEPAQAPLPEEGAEGAVADGSAAAPAGEEQAGQQPAADETTTDGGSADETTADGGSADEASAESTGDSTADSTDGSTDDESTDDE